MLPNSVDAAFIGVTLICWSCASLADSVPDNGQTVFGRAPIGHRQPRAPKFLPRSAADQTEQNRESDFDAKQNKQNIEFDKNLNICRCGTEKPVER